MSPFPSLPANLTAFCRVLRRRHGFRVGPGEAIDAARALEVVRLADERAVRHALRPILSCTPREAALFDRRLPRLLLSAPGPEPAARGRDDRMPRPTRVAALWRRNDGRRRRTKTSRTRRPSTATAAGDPIDTADSALEAPALFARASYSPLAAKGAGDAPGLARADDEWRAAARGLVRRLHVGPSRRWLPPAAAGASTCGGRCAPACRLVASRWTRGGSPPATHAAIRPAHRRQPIDERLRRAGAPARRGDGECQHARRSLHLLHGASSRDADVRAAVAGGRRRLDSLEYAWGGGTSIGSCLHDFVRHFGERLLGRETLVIIVSDGLDVGNRRRCARRCTISIAARQAWCG